MINIGVTTTNKPMLGSLFCKFSGHEWSPEDFNEFTTGMDIGDEATTRCRRCNRQMATIEKLPDGSLKWIPHHPDAVLYELTDKAKKMLSTADLEKGSKTNLDKFQEEFK